MAPRIDIHQHLWPEPLLDGLARRSEPPMLVRHRAGWTLRAPGEPEFPFEPGDHDPQRRADQVYADGLDLALIAPSTPLGIEALPPAEAEPLLEAYHAGVAALPAQFGAWAAVSLSAPDAGALAHRLEAGFVGACVSASALAGPAGFEHLGPVLEVLERQGAPLFIHPGPPTGEPSAGIPPWWSAMTEYVGAMQTAWHAVAVWGRSRHPRLRVCFAMLAGLAPLQRERLTARGAEARTDENAFLDTSSYGPRAIDAVLREVGVDRLVHGSDRPVIAAVALELGDSVRVALRERNPGALLSTNTPTEAIA